MDVKFVGLAAFAIAVTTLAASPAFAERRGGESHSTHHGENRRTGEHAQRRAQASRPSPAPRVGQTWRGQQLPQYQRTQPRFQGRVSPHAEASPRYYGGRAVPRTSSRYNSSYGHGNYGYRPYGRYYATPWHGWYGYAPFRPYYFRPHLSIGFGLYVGYPTPYYAYPYPVPVYGYGAPPSEVRVGPSSPAYGGVALEIGPNDAVTDAAVFVDGTYAGVVSDFDGTRQPLTLTQGTHHVEISHTGFQPLAFDVTVQAGMVTPYQGSLQPD